MVTDVQESVHWVRYRPRSDSQLVIFADDTNPRWVTHLVVLDPSTVAVSDKFGNVSILRLPSGVVDDVEDDPSGNRALWDRGLLGGASQKVEVSSFDSMCKAGCFTSKCLLEATDSFNCGICRRILNHRDSCFCHCLVLCRNQDTLRLSLQRYKGH